MEKSYIAQRENEKAARTILGDDIVFPDEIAEARGVSYTDVDLKRFGDMMLSEEILHWCKANGYAIVAGPPTPMGLLEVRSLELKLFDSTREWYKECTFGDQDKCKSKWLAIRKKHFIDSIDKTWDEQSRLLTEDERVPNTGEMSWFVTTWYKVRGVQLFKDIYVRVSSTVAPRDYHIYIGGFDERGFDVGECWDGRCVPNIGLTAARRKL